MTIIEGVNIPPNKRIVKSLTYVVGIGDHVSEKICQLAGISVNTKARDLTKDDEAKIRKVIEGLKAAEHLKFEGELLQEVSINIKKKKDIRCYQGLRHMKKLPVRGQNTHSNARTRKGKKSLPVAGKKKANKK